jgi:hypothetical protein
MNSIITPTNLAIGDLQGFVGEDKEIAGPAFIIRNNGGGKLAGKGGYECSIPLGWLGNLEEIIKVARVQNGVKSFEELIAAETEARESAEKAAGEAKALNEQVSTLWAGLESNAKLLNVLREIRDQKPEDPQGNLIKLDIEDCKELVADGVIDSLLKDPDSGEITHWSNEPKDYCFTALGLHVQGLLFDKDGIFRPAA